MNDFEVRYNKLKRAKKDLEDSLIRLESRRDSKKEALTALMAELKTKYNINSVDELRTKLLACSTKMEEIKKSIEDSLTRFEEIINENKNITANIE